MQIAFSCTYLLNSGDITIIKLRIINSGNESILINNYDPRYDWGIEISNGNIISDPVITNSSDSSYFSSISLIKSKSDSSIIFEKTIFDPKDYFDIKFYVIGDLNKDIDLKIFSKISKIKSIEIVESINENENEIENISKSSLLLLLIVTLLSLISALYLNIKGLRDAKKYDNLVNSILELKDVRNKQIVDSKDGSRYSSY